MDAQRPVPRLWIRSAEVSGGGGRRKENGKWEHNKFYVKKMKNKNLSAEFLQVHVNFHDFRLSFFKVL